MKRLTSMKGTLRPVLLLLAGVLALAAAAYFAWLGPSRLPASDPAADGRTVHQPAQPAAIQREPMGGAPDRHVGTPTPPLEVEVRDLATGEGREGVRISVQVEGTSTAAYSGPSGVSVLPAVPVRGQGHLHGECTDGWLLDMPRFVDLETRHHRVLWTSALRVFGQVRRHDGTPVVGASIHLVVPLGLSQQPTAPPPWPEARSLTKTDSAGMYSVALDAGWPEGSWIVAAQRGLIPAARPLAQITNTACNLDFDLEAGFGWRVRAVGQNGNGVPGLRVTAITSSSPVLDGWPPDDVPADVGGELGVVSRRAVTDADGLARIADWPLGRGARVKVVGDRRRRIEMLDGEPAVHGRLRIKWLPEPDGDLEIRVRVTTLDEIVMTGTCSLLSTVERQDLRLVRRLGESTAEIALLKVSPNGDFEARWGLQPQDRGGVVQLKVVAEWSNREQRSTLGTYRLRGDLRVDGVVITK